MLAEGADEGRACLFVSAEKFPRSDNALADPHAGSTMIINAWRHPLQEEQGFRENSDGRSTLLRRISGSSDTGHLRHRPTPA
jgi:hypothetical protein